MEIYEDNVVVVWKFVWVIDGVKQKEYGSYYYLFIRLFIKFDEFENEFFIFFEVNCCFFLRLIMRFVWLFFVIIDMLVFLFWERKFE